MNNQRKYCKLIETGEPLEILEFTIVPNYAPYVVRAICVNANGEITTPSISEILMVTYGL